MRVDTTVTIITMTAERLSYRSDQSAWKPPTWSQSPTNT